MNYIVLFILIATLYLIFGIISPTIRNILRLKKDMPLENNIGAFLAKKIYKKK